MTVCYRSYYLRANLSRSTCNDKKFSTKNIVTGNDWCFADYDCSQPNRGRYYKRSQTLPKGRKANIDGNQENYTVIMDM